MLININLFSTLVGAFCSNIAKYFNHVNQYQMSCFELKKMIKMNEVTFKVDASADGRFVYFTVFALI